MKSVLAIILSGVVGMALLGLRAAEPPALPETGERHAELASFDRLMTSFVQKYELPGAALAVAKGERIVYNRGFGYADREKKEPVRPNSLFRIASISKSFTAVAILQLVEQGRLKLDDHVFKVLDLQRPAEGNFDKRWEKVTILQLLHHTGGWNRDRKDGFDPMFISPRIVRALHIESPADASAIIRYMVGQPLDFDPGTEYHYSNFGYCLLGRVIEKLSEKPYGAYVRQHLLTPLGIESMRLGHTLLRDRAEHEVHYYVPEAARGKAILGPELGKMVPEPYGPWDLEAMDSHGGWLATAADLVRFGASLNQPKKCKILDEKSIETLFARPRGAPGENKQGRPRDVYYGCGWEVRHLKDGTINTWHNGSLPGTSTLLVRRGDGLTWAVLFNTRNIPGGKEPADLIDGLLHEAADAVQQWPR